jgi:hypothetical protein
MVNCQYVISAENHAEIICGIIKNLVDATAAKPGVNTLRHQFKLYKGEFQGSCYVEPKTLAAVDYAYSTNPDLAYFSDAVSDLGKLELKEVDQYDQCDLRRRLMQIKSEDIPQ